MEDIHLSPEQALKILVLDDDDSLRQTLAVTLEQVGYQVQACKTPDDALSALERDQVDIVLCDLMMPGMDGLGFIRACREKVADASIVMMTAYGNTEVALQALRAGAYDYLAKPFSGEELLFTLKKIEEREKLKAENAALKSVVTQRYNFNNIVAQSESMKLIFETVKRLSQFSTTILITGESGTGKELLARAIHHNSTREGKPFVAINCGAIPENLMESELFGHRRGSFTDATRDKKGLLEEASGGTIFLDEIGELPLHLQVKLLRVLQERQIRRVGDEQNIPIDVRIIAATLRDLEQDVLKGRFRDDLFYRLNVVSIHIPSLRERTEDIPVLIQHFLKKHNKKLGLSIKQVDPEAMRCLMQYYWKGNVRELENCIERALVLTESETIDINSLPPAIKSAGGFSSSGSEIPELTSDDNLSIKQKTKSLEINLILRALKKTKGNRTHAAKILEISHRALLYKLKEYEIGEK